MTEIANRGPDGPIFNPFEPGYHDDPYSRYARLRDSDPVHKTAIGAWVLTRHRAVAAVLSDHRQSVEFRRASAEIQGLFQSVAADRTERDGRTMLSSDPPTHTRLRKLVSKAFTPRAIRELEGRVAELVDEALDGVEDDGEMDVIGDLAFPLPFTVISEMLGMPTQRRDELREWSGAVVKMLDPIAMGDEVSKAVAASEKMDAYIAEVIADKRKRPADDMLTALISAEEAGDQLTPEELQYQVSLLYIAGHETTVNLIGNGVLALLRNRAQLERLRDDPSIEANAVEELLRYDSPVQFSRRVTLEPIELDDTTIEPGAVIMLGLGAANRDPEMFGPDAGELDLGRADAGKHVAFGGGVHYCLGAALARIEGRAAITRLVRRFPKIEMMSEDVSWNGRMNLRGLAELPVTLR